ncbi:MAG: hypothetical protein ACYC65_01780 [Candidatus Limnocylindrales bacterium]
MQSEGQRGRYSGSLIAPRSEFDECQDLPGDNRVLVSGQSGLPDEGPEAQARAKEFVAAKDLDEVIEAVERLWHRACRAGGVASA